MDVLGISGGYSMATSRLSTPPQKFDITDPVDIYTTNGKKISVMQYDERSQTDKSPTPAPSMVTVVPKSRWRKEYNFSVQLPAQIFGVTDNQFMNIISDSLNDIKVSVDGGPEKNLVGNVTNMKTYASVSKQYSLKGAQYRIGAGSYYLHSDYPFIAYVYGMNQLEPWGFGGSYYWTYETEFATTGGMQLNTGIVPNFAVSIESCSAWHVCIRDTGKNDPGIKAVILIDDPDGVYFDKVGLKYNNTSLDTGSTDYVAGELHPHWHSSQAYCFDVSLPNPLAPAMAPLAIIDNLGNTSILVLSRSASPLKLSTNPPTSGRADSIVFPVQKIGSEVCTTFVFKNTAAVGSPAINLNSAVLHGGDPSFTLQSVTPPLPHAIAAGDSLLMRVCYKPNDSLRHRDSLIVKSDCFTVGISIDAHGSTTGYINAEDLEFGSVTVGKQYCQNVIIHNVGQAPFTLEKSWLLSDTANFSVDTRSGASLPVLIQPGKSFSLGVCFHPRAVGRDSGRIDWSTDLEPQFMHTIKDYSIISGTGIPEIIESVHSSKIAAQTLSIRPNPASGNSAVCYFSEPLQGMATLAIIDILGREISKGPIPTGISKIEIPLRSLHEGIYYIRVTSANGVMTQKLEVTK
ncbi:MAG: choice-of-anchor D domain-containing protein, partial [Bacteroidota bacterium]|nr:choice-of-anchor D domain-containing protein [Bacteroidota bacterium]